MKYPIKNPIAEVVPSQFETNAVMTAVEVLANNGVDENTIDKAVDGIKKAHQDLSEGWKKAISDKRVLRINDGSAEESVKLTTGALKRAGISPELTEKIALEVKRAHQSSLGEFAEAAHLANGIAV